MDFLFQGVGVGGGRHLLIGCVGGGRRRRRGAGVQRWVPAAEDELRVALVARLFQSTGK